MRLKHQADESCPIATDIDSYQGHLRDGLTGADWTLPTTYLDRERHMYGTIRQMDQQDRERVYRLSIPIQNDLANCPEMTAGSRSSAGTLAPARRADQNGE
jgi:hypothetical protein